MNRIFPNFGPYITIFDYNVQKSNIDGQNISFGIKMKEMLPIFQLFEIEIP